MEGIRGHLHPLQDPHILKHIFKGFRGSHLKEFRLVCRAWRHNSNKAFRAAVKVNIECYGYDEGMLEFLKLCQSEWSTFFESPFSNVFTLTNGNAMSPDFWKHCGFSIKSLKFDRFQFPGAHILIKMVLRSCPNLEHLELIDVRIGGVRPPPPTDWTPPPSTVFGKKLKSLTLEKITGYIPWLTILAQFPFIENLHVDIKKLEGGDLFRPLGIYRTHDDSFWKLKKLHFSFDSVHETQMAIDLFAEGKLTLEELSIQNISDEGHISAVQKILTAHSTTLKKLALAASVDLRGDIFPLPNNATLEKVDDLSLEFRSAINLDYLIFVPNFKKLTLQIPGFYKDWRMEDFKVPSCTELKITHPFREFHLSRVYSWLPNLQVLETKYTENIAFRVICEKCPNLKSLWLNNSSVDDCGITGLDEEDVKRINLEGMMEGAFRPITVPRANISSLKCLEKFKRTWRPNLKCLDFCAAAYGFQRLPQLKSLSVATVGSSEDGDAMWKKLHAQYPWDGEDMKN